MKNIYKYVSFSALALAAGLTACHNGDIEFDDYEGGISVYFPYQTPVRTLVMGEDTYNTDLDNKYKCKISTTMGGSYTGKNITVEVEEDPSLLNKLCFGGDAGVDFNAGKDILPMPYTHYDLSGHTMDFGGTMVGSIEVTLTEAFFKDEKAIAGEYVIPLVIKEQNGADTILVGKYDEEVYSSKPQRTNADAWKTLPKDYTLFCINYISKYEGYFLRNVTSLNGVAQSRAEGKTLLDDPIVNTNTLGLYEVSYEVSNTVDGIEHKHTIILTFDGSKDEVQNCKITAPAGAQYTVSGDGTYGDHKAIKAWGDKDRDQLDLNYKIVDGDNTIDVKETLILQRRGIKTTTFKVAVKQ
ncbi:MAG: DUF5627 domain-containing protein [Bacteroidales bacterium]|nr:DUF5627 domain-containing protein [Bacteroidales bacterium]